MKGIYLLLGSNLGNRERSLERALEGISERVGEVCDRSSVYESAPWGVEDQPVYLNQVLKVETELEPIELLRAVLAIEADMGRVRRKVWGARVIDIDVLYYGNEIIRSRELQVPHPRLHERRFTLEPICEIAPDETHPIFGLSQMELLDRCPDSLAVTKRIETEVLEMA
ncbi:2-amino-4-hydroxy-6-hydroxymethyldihydropteridine diphosphokinase [Fulvitalea axinellae]|uniref:2-amino-4-hydroxy-6-hydroxymethyldihydropteridine pyrophosphokinase n=1 Tax=Fulvitalea axinellae TaxID=1182444 RepID=A0AAU9D8J0_9BACT|nr:2-amino-4-hydroxy-6-hydroxymethyldihydropteridine diphosphokinase [Fulvitalea axinellae]